MERGLKNHLLGTMSTIWVKSSLEAQTPALYSIPKEQTCTCPPESSTTTATASHCSRPSFALSLPGTHPPTLLWDFSF